MVELGWLTLRLGHFLLQSGHGGREKQLEDGACSAIVGGLVPRYLGILGKVRTTCIEMREERGLIIRMKIQMSGRGQMARRNANRE